jgi:hypothetical protein
MGTLIEQAGGPPQRQPKYVPIFLDRSFTGLFTQRSVLHDPSDPITAKYYGGRPDTLWQGSNIELTNRLTLQRRPGLIPFVSNAAPSGFLYPTPPDYAFSFQLSNGSIQVIVDTATAVYIDNQDGTATLLRTKSTGAGQTHFVAVAGVLYAGDGVDTWIYTPGNGNGTVWHWGIAPPTTPPVLTVVSSGASATRWVASTVWSTMGLVDDPANNAVYQLQSVNVSGTNTTQFGTSGSGQPAWAGIGGTTVDGTITWTNTGPIVLRTPSTQYNAANGGGGTLAHPDCVYDPATHSIYVNISGALATTSAVETINFKAGAQQHTQDGGVKWLWVGDCSPSGTITTWQPSHTYPTVVAGLSNQKSAVVEPTNLYNGLPTNVTVYLQFNFSAGTVSAASATSPFSSATNVSQLQTTDGDLSWMGLGTYVWAASHNYIMWTQNGQAFSVVKSTVSGVDYWQVCTQGGTSGVIIPGSSYTTASVANAVGPTTTYTLSATPSPLIPASTTNAPSAVTISGFSNAGNNGIFPVVSQTGNQLVVSNPNGVSEAGANPVIYNAWGTYYGNVTADGTAAWTCVGKTMDWAANTKWFLPVAGFIPPSSSSPYGGASVIDSNNNVEFTISSGLGGATAPAWSTVNNGSPSSLSVTADGSAIWFNLEAFTSVSMSWTKGFVYAYSFKARALDDFYSPLPLGGGAIPPPGPPFNGALPPPTGSLTEAISTASPTASITGPNAGAVIFVSGKGSIDPQVDTIVIWRSADGGTSGQMFELTEIPNPPPVNGAPGTWTFEDFLTSTPTTVGGILFPGLNTLIPAPIGDVNDQPNSAFLPMVYNFQRIWGSIGEYVAFSGGPDVLTGNPNVSFAPADVLPFLAPVIRIVKSPQGLIVFLTNSIEVIAGGPLTSSFFSVTWAPGIGLLSYNALDVFTGEIYFFAADNQFRIMTPSLNITNAGFALGDQFANLPSSGTSDTTWDPSKVYVASHQSGIDNCIFVADGATGWYRLNPRQVPGAQQGPEPIWSPYANVTGGCKMVESIETTPGIKKLLVGGVAINKQILKRSLSIFTDDGTSYDAYFVMGAITLAHSSQIALLKHVEFDFSGVNFQPTVSYLLNEISGTFTSFTALPVFDPPSLYGGRNVVPSSYSPLRYYFLSNASLARCRFLQVKVDFGSTSTGDEMYTMAIIGRLMVEV